MLLAHLTSPDWLLMALIYGAGLVTGLALAWKLGASWRS